MRLKRTYFLFIAYLKTPLFSRITARFMHSFHYIRAHHFSTASAHKKTPPLATIRFRGGVHQFIMNYLSYLLAFSAGVLRLHILFEHYGLACSERLFHIDDALVGAASKPQRYVALVEFKRTVYKHIHLLQ